MPIASCAAVRNRSAALHSNLTTLSKLTIPPGLLELVFHLRNPPGLLELSESFSDIKTLRHDVSLRACYNASGLVTMPSGFPVSGALSPKTLQSHHSSGIVITPPG